MPKKRTVELYYTDDEGLIDHLAQTSPLTVAEMENEGLGADELNVVATAGLTKRQFICFKLYYFEEYSQAEIGDILGISRQTVWRHIKKGKERLRKTLTFPYK